MTERDGVGEIRIRRGKGWRAGLEAEVMRGPRTSDQRNESRMSYHRVLVSPFNVVISLARKEHHPDDL